MRASRIGRLCPFHDALRMTLSRSSSTSPANNSAVVQRTPRVLNPHEGARPQVQHDPCYGYSSFAHQSHTRILKRDARPHNGRVERRRSRVGTIHRPFAKESSGQVAYELYMRIARGWLRFHKCLDEPRKTRIFENKLRDLEKTLWLWETQPPSLIRWHLPGC